MAQIADFFATFFTFDIFEVLINFSIEIRADATPEWQFYWLLTHFATFFIILRILI